MIYNFDEVIDRQSTLSIKHMVNAAHPADMLRLWVADMDFRTCGEVVDALKKTAEHGIYGYSMRSSGYFEALHDWQADNFGWEVEEDWLCCTPGIVGAVNVAIQAYTLPGEKVLIQQPVYHPFAHSILDQGRKVVNAPLWNHNGHYEIDFAEFERIVKTEEPRLFILCSPHNPVSRAWTQEELLKMGEICLKYGVIVVSDEIHQDFVFMPRCHIPFASLSNALADISVTCTAPSKTFNMPGLEASNIFIPNKNLRDRFKKIQSYHSGGALNLMALTACEAAYRYGRDWLDQLLAYLKGNFDFVRDYLKSELPEIKLTEPEATYLLWLDFNALGFSEERLNELIAKDARLWLNAGSMFGPGGEGFQRLNAGCPRSVLEEALNRLSRALGAL